MDSESLISFAFFDKEFMHFLHINDWAHGWFHEHGLMFQGICKLIVIPNMIHFAQSEHLLKLRADFTWFLTFIHGLSAVRKHETVWDCLSTSRLRSTKDSEFIPLSILLLTTLYPVSLVASYIFWSVYFRWLVLWTASLITMSVLSPLVVSVKSHSLFSVVNKMLVFLMLHRLT